jgi:transglutaminase-like putative cysteine protease
MTTAASSPSLLTERDDLALRSMGLRALRRLLACLAILSCALLREFPLPVILTLVGVCWLEQFVPSHLYFREEGFQRAVAWICYLTLPFFLTVFLVYNTANPFHDALIGFLVFFQLKWAYAPRSDFHWIGAIFLFSLVVVRTQSVFFGLLLGAFFILSIPYLTGLQEFAAMPSSVAGYLGSLKRRRRARLKSLSLAPAALVIAVAIFYLWPRTPERNLSLGGAEAYTQLTDQVSLHKEGALKKDFKIVARLRPLEGFFSPGSLYLRGGHLNLINDSNWTFFRDNESPVVDYFNSVEEAVGSPALTHWPSVPDDTPWRERLARARKAYQEIRYRLTVYDASMEYFVRPGGAIEIKMPARLRSKGSEFYELTDANYPIAMDVRALLTPEREGEFWEVYPFLSPRDQKRLMMPSAMQDRLRYWPGREEKRDRHGQVAQVLYSRDYWALRELGNRWKNNAAGGAEIATAFARQLRDSNRFRYDLDPQRPPLQEGQNPLLPFLFNPRYNSGHCEMFAGSMVALLRTQRIPARLANGFRGAEYDPEAGDWVIRRMMAHTWVEVWDEDLGWLAFDPTPAEAFRSYEGRIYYKALRERFDNMDLWWRKTVVSYDHAVQSEWLRRLRRWTSRGTVDVQERVSSLLRPYGWLREKIAGDPVLTRLFWGVLIFQGVLVAVLLARWLGRRTGADPQESARRLGQFWARVEKAAGARRGDSRQPAETYRQALDRLLPTRAERIDATLFADLAFYLEGRAYGGAPESQERQLELLDRLESLMDKARRSSWNAAPGMEG